MLIENTNDPKMKELLELARQIKDSDIPVLIVGETGTGKELMADYIQAKSSRSSEVYNKINCAAIPDTLIESEFFGHLKGAFTGSAINRIGIFEQSNNGTIFLDEIGDLSEPAQSKILRVLQEKKIKKVGSCKDTYANFRVISATNKNLIYENAFRKDLYYRISGIVFELPPLRERLCDIDFLCDCYVTKFAEKLNRKKPDVNSHTIALLKNYNWPGNIREFENLIQRSVIVSNGTLNINFEINSLFPVIEETQNFNLEYHERNLIMAALIKEKYVQKDAALLLGLTPRALNYKISQYGITFSGWKINK